MTVMYQKWRDLFFLHWKCDPKEIQQTLPKGLAVDTFADHAYIGIVPFKVFGLRPVFVPPLPGISHFLEVNVRTYVLNDRGEPGIWFYSLDANRLFNVMMAKLAYKLPYIYSNILCEQNGNFFHYQLTKEETSFFELSYNPPLFKSDPGSLEHFLIERYRLYSERYGKLYFANVSHHSYDLASANLLRFKNKLFNSKYLHIKTTDDPFHILYSPGVDVKVRAIKKDS